MADEDRPVGAGGGADMITIKLPRGAKPLSGDFTITPVSPDKPFVRIVFRGPSSLEAIKPQPDGSLEWEIRDNQWEITIE